MKKRTLALMMAAMMMVGVMAGCSNGDSQTSQPADTNTESAAPSEDQSAAPSQDASAELSGTVVN